MGPGLRERFREEKRSVDRMLGWIFAAAAVTWAVVLLALVLGLLWLVKHFWE